MKWLLMTAVALGLVAPASGQPGRVPHNPFLHHGRTLVAHRAPQTFRADLPKNYDVVIYAYYANGKQFSENELGFARQGSLVIHARFDDARNDVLFRYSANAPTRFIVGWRVT